MMVAGGLAPWLAFLVVTAIASRVTDGDFFIAGMIVTAPFYWLVVGLPSVAVVAAARHRSVAVAGLVVMAAVAVYAGAGMAASDDAQAGLMVLIVPMVGVPLAVLCWIGQSVAYRRTAHRAGIGVLAAADLDTRGCALAIDVLAAGALVLAPVSMLSHAGQEVAAAALGIAAATASLALPLARRGHTLGQGLLGLRTVDAATGEPLPLARASARSLVITLEVLGTITFVLAVPAAIDLIAVAAGKRTLVDRLFRTSVLAHQ